MGWEWLGAALVLAVGDWIARGMNWPKLRILTKPGTMIAVIGWFSVLGGWQADAFWFGVALIFSLIGDVMLMLPPSYFILGLVGFFIAHVFYLVGFNQGLPPLRWESLALLLPIIVVDAVGYRQLRRGVISKPETRRLRLPVFAYLVVISLMLYSALLTLLRPEWPLNAALLASGGAILFFFSDMTLSRNRFIAPTRYGRVIVMITYHLGQIAIVAGVLLKINAWG